MRAHNVVRTSPFQALETICCVWAVRLVADGATFACNFDRAMRSAYVFLAAVEAHQPGKSATQQIAAMHVALDLLCQAFSSSWIARLSIFEVSDRTYPSKLDKFNLQISIIQISQLF